MAEKCTEWRWSNEQSAAEPVEYEEHLWVEDSPRWIEARIGHPTIVREKYWCARCQTQYERERLLEDTDLPGVEAGIP